MENNKLELRVTQINLKTEDEQLIVEGLVNKTESWSETLGRVKKFKEKISKGAFSRALTRAKTVDFLAEHDKSKILASTSNESLELFEDEEGLKMRARIAPTSYGKDFYTLIKEGIINHMSFGFSVIDQEFNRKLDGNYERIVKDLNLFEVSAVRNPAYSASAISARGIEVVEDLDIPEIEEEERALDNDVLANILEQLKANNELLNKFGMQTVNLEAQKEVVVEAPILETPKEIEVPKVVEVDIQPEKVITEPVKEQVQEIIEPKVTESQVAETPKVEEVKVVVDLSAQKNILDKFMEGEVD